MLRAKDLDPSTINLVVSEDCTVNRFGNNKFDGAKVNAKTDKSKS